MIQFSKEITFETIVDIRLEFRLKQFLSSLYPKGNGERTNLNYMSGNEGEKRKFLIFQNLFGTLPPYKNDPEGIITI